MAICTDCRFFEDKTRPPTKMWPVPFASYWCRWSSENKSAARKLPYWARRITRIPEYQATLERKCPAFLPHPALSSEKE